MVYVRFPPARTLLTVLGPAPLGFVALFLLVSDASDLVFPASADVQAVHVRSSAPVVLVIFDEFPVHSLMGRRPHRRRRYPNFARLARDATWYRNTASVDQDTPYAVPGDPRRAPAAPGAPAGRGRPPAQHVQPARGPRLRAARARGRDALCSPGLCTDRQDSARSGDDVAALYAPRAAPDEVEDELPSVERDRRARRSPTRAWSPRETKRHRYIRIHANLAHDRPGRFEQFVSEIEGDPGPRLHLIHILLPHVPYQYLPSGRFYRRTPKEALPGHRRAARLCDPFVVEQAYQRHLLQLAGHRPAARRAARPPPRDRDLRPRGGGGGGRPRHQLPPRPRPAPAAPRERRGHRAGAVPPEGARPEARAHQRPAAADDRRAAHDRGRARHPHPLAGRRPLGARPAAGAPARDGREEVQAHLPGRHALFERRKRAALARKVRAVRRRASTRSGRGRT